MEKGEIIVDGQNVVELEQLGISLMAVEDKIIVMHDDFKSGYECKTCKRKGLISGCEACNNSGLDRFEQTCKICNGAGANFKRQCPDCKGKGELLVIPQTAKSLPTTGIVVSMGPDTPAMKITNRILNLGKGTEFDLNITEEQLKEQLKAVPIRLGARVIFGPHVGTLIPFKGNIKLKIMRVHEPLAVLFGSDTASKDFIDYETDKY